MSALNDTAARRYFISTPIYYVNGEPHLGHAYTSIAADVLARFHRLDGRDVHFLTGTDEHGQKVQKSATDAGISPQEFADRVAARFRAMAEAVGCSFDDFIRTTEPRHVTGTQRLWEAMAKAKAPNGEPAIYLDSYSGWYAVRDEAFYNESELTEGPDGTKLAPSGAPVAWVEEPSYFFRLSAYADALLAHYEANPDFILPESRRNEVMSFVRGGLEDLSISRTTFDWGIPVPGDEKHVMYVWLDALANYLTALGYPEMGEGSKMARWWPADLHLVGKEIVRFHAVYWPAFLMAAGLPLPKRVFGHGWWTVEGEKMSKSLGNAIDPFALIERYGLDQYRFGMLRDVPFGNDGDFSDRGMTQRINADLANGLGNLAQRVLTLVQKNCGAAMPVPSAMTEDDEKLLEEAERLIQQVRAAMAVPAFSKALDAIWAVVSAADVYIDRQAPWALRKTDPARMATVLSVLCEVLRHLGILLQPFMPGSMTRLLDYLGVPAGRRSFAALGEGGRIPPGTPLPPPQGLFPRIESAA